MRVVFHLAGEEDVIVARYLEKIIKKLKLKANLLDEDDQMSGDVSFEEILFLRIAFEFTKMYKGDRSDSYLELVD
jgi:hypothetical protein